MTDDPRPRRTVTLRSSSGKPLLTLGAWPAAAAVAGALLLLPRASALAALGALAGGMSLDVGPGRRPSG